MAGVLGLTTREMDGALAELDTARLSLRLARPAMAAAMARFMAGNWEGHLDRWSPPAGTEWFGEAFWEERLDRAVLEWHAGTSARFVLLESGPQSGEVIGTVNYSNIVRGPFQACHLGFQIARSHQAMGLMSEALRALNAFAFGSLRLHRIMANHIPENARSGRLLQRLGFVREGFARNYLFIDGAWRDHILTALTNPEFDNAWLSTRR